VAVVYNRAECARIFCCAGKLSIVQWSLFYGYYVACRLTINLYTRQNPMGFVDIDGYEQLCAQKNI
jgi:hypothetical protein